MYPGLRPQEAAIVSYTESFRISSFLHFMAAVWPYSLRVSPSIGTPVTPESESPVEGTVTRLLAEVESGNKAAMSALFSAVYEELRATAHKQRRRWSGDSTIGTTALVHEAYLRVVDRNRIGARTREHFLRIAAMAMRQILSNYARERVAAKRGGAARKLSLDDFPEGAPPVVFSDDQSELLMALDDALSRLEAVDRRLSDVVECRFFGGLSVDDTAAVLEVSPATVKRDWTLARAWLFREIAPE